MPTNQTQADGFEFRVKRIFKRLYWQFRERDPFKTTFHQWLDMNCTAVGKVFLDDVEAYCGIPEMEDDADDD